MKCSEARRLLSACLDRDLTFAEDEELRRHLRECTTCRDEMACLENVQTMLRSLPETQPAPGFYESICRRIDEEKAQPSLLGTRTRMSIGGILKEALSPAWLRPAAGVAFGLVVGLLIQTGRGPSDSPGNLPMGEIQQANSTGTLADEQAEIPAGSVAARAEGPLADLALTGRAQPDTTQAEPEYILDPFVSGPQGRPVRMQVQTVSGDQHGYITF
jgi:hypothetical protein